METLRHSSERYGRLLPIFFLLFKNEKKKTMEILCNSRYLDNLGFMAKWSCAGFGGNKNDVIIVD
jgi:hypothetical protein